jgi:HEPN domain-containing protein
MDNRTISKEWFDIADKDLSSAKYLQNMHPIPIEIICYHCQQSAEKFLKGYLAGNGHKIVKTHDLILPNKLCKKFNDEFNCLMKNAYDSLTMV